MIALFESLGLHRVPAMPFRNPEGLAPIFIFLDSLWGSLLFPVENPEGILHPMAIMQGERKMDWLHGGSK